MSDVDTAAPAVDEVKSDPVPGTTDTPETAPKADPTPAPAATPEDDSDTKVVKKPWYQKKIAEQAYQIREAQRLNERLLGLIENNRQTERKTGDEAPKPDQFNSLNEYIDAQVEYKLKHSQEHNKDVPRETRSRVDPQFEAEREDLITEGLDKYEDFQDIVLSDAVRFTPVMANAILEANNRVELAYFLGKNPKEVNRISRLSPVRQIAEIARIEDKLNAKPTPVKKPSAAPAPVTPVSGTASHENGLSDKDDVKDWVKKFNKQRRSN